MGMGWLGLGEHSHLQCFFLNRRSHSLVVALGKINKQINGEGERGGRERERERERERKREREVLIVFHKHMVIELLSYESCF